MVQYVNQIESKKGFVDLHIHTDESYGDEMGKMNLSPEDLLESIYLYSEKNGCGATFSVTDHNSIEAVEKIKMLMKSDPKKYKSLRFITGCEFSCSAGSLGKYKDKNNNYKNVFHNFHILAYNFNINNPTLKFMCKLYSNKKENSINRGDKYISAGSYVISLKNILKEHGINLSLKNFNDISLNTQNISASQYISYLLNYIDKFKISEDIKKDVLYKLFNRDVLQIGKLDVMEIMEIVENAGGFCVLAHPGLLNFSPTGKKDRNLCMEFLKRKLKDYNISFGQTEAEQSLIIKYFTYYLKNRCISVYDKNKMLNGIVGAELLHSSSTFKLSTFDAIITSCQRNKLYMTVGSDSHGQYNTQNFLSLFLQSSILEDKNINNIVVTRNLFAKNIIKNRINKEPECDLPFDEQYKIIETVNGQERELSLKQLYLKLVQYKEKRKKELDEKKELEAQKKKLLKNPKTNAKKNKNSSQVDEHCTPEQLKILRKGLSQLESLNTLLENLLESYQMERKRKIEEYNKLKIYKENAIPSLRLLDENYETLKKAKVCQKLLAEFDRYYYNNLSFQELVVFNPKELKDYSMTNFKNINNYEM